METKFFFLNLAPPAFLVGFVCFARYVASRLPAERLRGWLLFCFGVLVAITGVSIAVYFMQVDFGAALVMVGAFVSAVGFTKFFGSR